MGTAPTPARDAVRNAVIADSPRCRRRRALTLKGLSYLVVRNTKTGEVPPRHRAMVESKLGEDEEIIEVWEKDPSVQAFIDLLIRALDKPKEQEQNQ